MKSVVKILYVIIAFIFLIYLLLPNPEFPSPPPDSLQSNEPADIETPLRRAYFTNYTREEVIENYRNQFKNANILNIPFPLLRLNYPPEESQILIRDQTRSTFLEELVHPLRESIFINGFEPKSDKDTIYINNIFWRQKIIIRYIPSLVLVRLIVGLFCVVLLPLIYINIKSLLSLLIVEVKKRWI